MDAITFDALTVAMVNDALAGRGIGTPQLAWTIREAVSTARQHRRTGIDVKVRSHGGVRTGGTRTALVHVLKVELSDASGKVALRMAGRLMERHASNDFEVDELGVGDRARFVAAHRDVLRLQVAQQLPETLRMGLSSLTGQPLSRLVGHAALERPEAAGILILSVEDPTLASRSRVGMPQAETGEGFDVRVDAPRAMVIPVRR